MARPVRDRSRASAVAGTVRVLAGVFRIAVRSRRMIAEITDLRELLAAADEWAAANRWRRPVDPRDLVRATKASLWALRAPDRSCVLRSLTLYTGLRRQDQPASFVSGVRKDAGALDGHAWVEAPSLPLGLTGDTSAPQNFAEGFRHPASRTHGR